ncbi:MAG: phosphate uptake regulator PhoU [Archaeoglobaceae archaeon]
MRFETRKIYVSGTNSYILTLPKEWVESLGLKKGDIVFLEIRDNSLSIYPQKRKKNFVCSIDDPKVTLKNLVRLIIAYYIAGFGTIKIKIYNEEQRTAVKSAIEMLMGAEIMEDLGDEMQIEIFLSLERFEINSVIEKMSEVILSMLKDYRETAMVGFTGRQLDSVLLRESEVDRLYFLLLRLLTLAGREGLMTFFDTMNYRSTVKALERIADHICRIFEVSNNAFLEEEVVRLVDALERLVRRTLVSFFKSDRKIADEVLEELEKITEHINLLKEKFKEDSRVKLQYQLLLSSLERIAGYLADIAEISIDRNVLLAVQ